MFARPCKFSIKEKLQLWQEIIYGVFEHVGFGLTEGCIIIIKGPSHNLQIPHYDLVRVWM